MLRKDIFLIPVKLDDCGIPKEVEEYQCVDLYRNNGLNKLIKAIEHGSEIRFSYREKSKPFNFIEYNMLESCDYIFKKLRDDYPDISIITIFDNFDYDRYNTSDNKLLQLLKNLIFEYSVKLIFLGHESQKKLFENIFPEFPSKKLLEIPLLPYPINKLVSEARNYLSHYIQFENKALESLISYSGGNLYCYQLIVDGLIRYLNEHNRSYFKLEDVKEIFDFILKFEDRSDFLHYWNSTPVGIRFLFLLFTDYERPRDSFQISNKTLSKWANIFPNREEVIEIFNSLAEHGYLQRDTLTDYKYRFKVPLFAEWLVRKYPNLESIFREFIEIVVPYLNKNCKEFLYGFKE